MPKPLSETERTRLRRHLARDDRKCTALCGRPVDSRLIAGVRVPYSRCVVCREKQKAYSQRSAA